MADPARLTGLVIGRARRANHAAEVRIPVRRTGRDLGRLLVEPVVRSATSVAAWARADERSLVQLVALVLTAIAALALVLYRRLLFPPKFSYDSDTIHRMAVARGNGGADDSFGNVAAVYRLAGLENSEVSAALVGYGLALAALGLVLWSRRFRLTPTGTAACALSIVFSAVYLGTYSKDVFVLPITILVLSLGRGLKREVVIVGGLLVYADVFRGYWYLVAGFYVVSRLVLLATGRRWTLLTVPFLGLIGLGVVFPLILGHPSDFARLYSNQWRMGSPDAATMITDYVGFGGPLGSIVNTVVVFVTLFVPVPLLVRGGSYYLAIGASFLVLWSAWFLGFARSGREPLAVRAVALLLAFTTTQALFEPDFGSVLRHLTPLLPLLCFVALAPRRPTPALAPRTVSIPIVTSAQRTFRERKSAS